MAPAASCPAALGTFMEPVAKDKILNTHFITGRERKTNRLSRYGLATCQFPWHQSGLLAQDRQASDRRRSGADGRAGQVGSVRTIPEHVGIGRLEELDVVLHAAVGALRLLQAIFQVLQPALVAAVSLCEEEGTGQVCVRCPAQTRPQ